MKTTLILNKKRIQTLAELKENFNQAELITYTHNGRLAKWLSEIGESEKGEKISSFNFYTSVRDILQELYHIFDLDDIFSQYIKDVQKEEELISQGKTDIVIDMEKKAESGDLWRIPFLIEYYDSISDGTNALKWAKKLAQLDFTNPMFQLGCRYLNGTNIPQDMKEAIFWLGKAADAHSGDAMVILARLYETGTECDANMPKVAELLIKAEATNPIFWLNESLRLSLGVQLAAVYSCPYLQIYNVPQDIEKALSYIEKAKKDKIEHPDDPILSGVPLDELEKNILQLKLIEEKKSTTN